jgi:hypothetical protein
VSSYLLQGCTVCYSSTRLGVEPKRSAGSMPSRVLTAIPSRTFDSLVRSAPVRTVRDFTTSGSSNLFPGMYPASQHGQRRTIESAAWEILPSGSSPRPLETHPDAPYGRNGAYWKVACGPDPNLRSIEPALSLHAPFPTVASAAWGLTSPGNRRCGSNITPWAPTWWTARASLRITPTNARRAS